MSEPERLGKYAVERVLGRGAMGVVYKARDPDIERAVAIKTVRKDLLDAELAQQFMARFRNEARAAGRLHHPNIVAIYEYGEDETIAYIAMEYVDGVGLREYLNRKARFALPQVAGIATQLLHALSFAHGQGVVHRDVKPANLILTAAGAVKVADFGIARIDATTLTMTGMVMGTPSYMSPEQCRGAPADARADLFSVGVVLYELLTGTRPFEGSMEAIAYRICHEPHRRASEIAPVALPPGVDALLDRALAKDAADRFPDARAFETALRAAFGAEAAPMTGTGTGETTLVNVADLRAALPTATTAAFDDAALSTIERELVRFVGPMARILVRQASTGAHDLRELRAILAAHIVDPAARAKFEARGLAPDAAAGQPTRAGTSPPAVAPTASSRATGMRAPQPLDAAFVEQTTARLAVYLGPIARIVVRNAARDARGRDEFLGLVAQHIGTQERHAFLRDMGGEK